jgi:recombinational DNA repair protein RecT
MKSVAFTFGRMNPPTTGHQLLVNKLAAYAKQHGASPRVYLSHSTGKKDPLQYDTKIAFARKAFGAIVKKSPAKNIIQILKNLEDEGFKKVVLIAGSDRIPEFTKLLNAYNGKEYNFDEIEVISAGERDPDADDVSGMSASKLRALAKDEKTAEFMRGAPSTLKITDKKSLYTAVRKALLGEDVMDYGHDERFTEFMIESAMKDDDHIEGMPSDAEIKKMLDDMDHEELDLHDTDALLLDIILGEPDEEDEEEMDEERKPLSIGQRQKMSQRMKRMAKRLARLRQIKSKMMPAQQRIKMRARKAALMSLRKRAAGSRGLNYSELSPSQRIAVDSALYRRFGSKLNTAVDRISQRILPNIRKKAQASVAQARARQRTNEAVNNNDNPMNVDATKLNAPHRRKTLAHRAIEDEKDIKEVRKSAIDKDARDPGDTNIVYQMRKTINSRGAHETTFANGQKASISISDAKKMLARFDSLRMPADKYEFTVQSGNSLSDFRSILSRGLDKSKKSKISLSGRSFREFRSYNKYQPDEPPGTRLVGEAKSSVGGVDPDANDDPNKPRKVNPKLDLLLRLGLVDIDELQKYRRALRSSKKQALQSPEMREKLADLLDRLLDYTVGDTQTYSRIRYRVQKASSESVDLSKKAEKSGIDVDILNAVFQREIVETNDINRAFDRVNSFIAGGKAAEMDKDLSEAIENKKGRIYKDGKWIGTVRHRGDSFISHRTHPTKKLSVVKSHKTRADAEKHIIKSHEMGEAVKEPTGGLKDACWKGYAAVGMKMKNGRSVPNCVPKEGVTENNRQKCNMTNEGTMCEAHGTKACPTVTKQMSEKDRKQHPEVGGMIDEATYKGKTVPLNKPMSGDVKKSKVYVDPDGDGKAQKVNFGDKKLSIKKNIPARKKSYCARSSGQGNLTDKTKANFWSRKAWEC